VGLLLQRKLSKIAVQRGPQSVNLGEYAPAPPELVMALLGAISGLLPVPDFPILPGDSLWSLFDLDQGCVENEIECVLERVAPGAPPLDAKSNVRAPETVSDLIHLVYGHAKPHLSANANS
jgi:hypothetical protein